LCYVPSLATDKVTAVLPVDTVVAVVAVPVVDGAAVVGPERVVEAVVGAGAAGGAGAGSQLAQLSAVEGEGEGAGGAEKDGLEGNHCCGWSVGTVEAGGCGGLVGAVGGEEGKR